MTSAAPVGGGWPGERAGPGTPVAVEVGAVADLAATAHDLDDLDARVSVCRACPRLVSWREEAARVKRAAFARQPYWGRPVTGFGPADASVAIVGLAPAAHGGNRTGRVFTGDRSGDWLFAALHRARLANRPSSTHAGDGLRLYGTRVLAAVRCAPPGNSPTPAERDACRPWLVRELELLSPTLRVVVALGGFGWQALWPAFDAIGVRTPRPRPAFGHGVEVQLPFAAGAPAADDAAAGAGRAPLTLLGCYHPSQQNTFTGRLTAPMLDGVLGRAAALGG